MSWMPFSESMLQVLFDATWQSALLAAIVFVVIRLVGRWMTPSWRVALSAIPLLRLVVLVLPVTAFSLFQWVDRPVSQLPVLQSETPLVVATAASQVELFSEASPVRSLVVTEAVKAPSTSSFSWTLLIQLTIAVWISGVVILSARRLYLVIILRRLLKRGEQPRDLSLQTLIDVLAVMRSWPGESPAS